MPKSPTLVYVPFPDETFTVRTRDREGKYFQMDSTAIALHLSRKYGRLYVSYSGERAGDSHLTMELPHDAEFLRLMANQLNEIANNI